MPELPCVTLYPTMDLLDHERTESADGSRHCVHAGDSEEDTNCGAHTFAARNDPARGAGQLVSRTLSQEGICR